MIGLVTLTCTPARPFGGIVNVTEVARDRRRPLTVNSNRVPAEGRRGRRRAPNSVTVHDVNAGSGPPAKLSPSASVNVPVLPDGAVTVKANVVPGV